MLPTSINCPTLVKIFLLVCLISLFACKKDDPAPAQTSNAFVGTYKGKIDASGVNAQGSYTITMENATITIAQGASANDVTWKIVLTTGTSDTFKATTNGTTVTIPQQTVKDISGKSSVYQGTGKLAGNQLSMTIDHKEDGTPAGTYTYLITASK